MNKVNIILLILIGILLMGCVRYGEGQSVGYIYAVDDGIVWDKVWFKTNLQSSQSDCYLINNKDLKERLRNINGEVKIKIYYDRHIITLSTCPEGTTTQDEITKVEILE